jgi:hypothetical protein
MVLRIDGNLIRMAGVYQSMASWRCGVRGLRTHRRSNFNYHGELEAAMNKGL